MSFLPLVRFWILFSTLAVCSGWTLSAMGQLNVPGYLVMGGLAALGTFLYRRRQPPPKKRAAYSRWRRWQARFRRPWPFCFLVLSTLIFVGGVCYAPSNYDALTYRLPRVSHWLAEERWHWIHTPNWRLNIRACGIEWLMAPPLLFFKSARGLFLINFVSQLLLPGLVFSVFRRLGVRRRVAWSWMWIFPAGYNFVLQAGSLGNDTFAAVYTLAAMDFALRARQSGRLSDFWLSGLAAALLSGSKAGNLPLLLPWAVAIWPSLRLAGKNLLGTTVVVLLGVMVSLGPISLLNIIHAGDWTGLSFEGAGIASKNPLVTLTGEMAMLAVGNAVPPVFPLAGWWNSHFLSFWPEGLRTVLETNFEAGFYRLLELPTEEMAGMGCAVSLLLAASLWARWRSRGPCPGTTTLRLLWLAPWVALAALYARTGISCTARITAAYYPLLLPGFLAGAPVAQLMRGRAGKALGYLALGTAIFAVIVTPARPLFPAAYVFDQLQALRPESRLVARAKAVYGVYATRADLLGAVRERLPAEVRLVGFFAGPDDTDVSLWQPWGERRVVTVGPQDDWDELNRRGVHWFVVKGTEARFFLPDLDTWLKAHRAELVWEHRIAAKYVEGEQRWWLIRMEPAAGP